MKQILHTFALIFLCSTLTLAQNWEISPQNDYDLYFAEAYQLYPEIPKGILEAIAYSNTHVRHIQPQNEQPSCTGLPQYFGVMGLVEDGKGYFNNSLQTVATLSGYSISQIKNDPRINILAFAKAYNELIESYALRGKELTEQYQVLDALTEIPNDGQMGNNYAFEAQLYSIYKNLNTPKFQQAYRLPAYQLDLPKLFGEENYKILSAAMVTVSPVGVDGEEGKRYNTSINRSAPPPCSDVSVGFPHAVLSAAADPSNYSSRNGVAITHVTIHTMQGSYAGAISWFQNPAANVSAHYNIRASDGQITQSVCEFDKGWHVSNSNPYAIGIEHEGYVDDASWYTDVMYRVSADLTKDIANRYGMQLERTYDINGDNGLNPISDGCFKVKGHQHFPNQTHTDPGQYWDWNRYYDLLNPTSSATTNTYTTCSGTFYDSGGSGGNYTNDERIFYLIAPTAASSVTLTFNMMDLELNYDYLYVYDGDSDDDPLLMVLNGNTPPPPITGTSGALLLEFRTDCGTVNAGWDASWTCSTAAPACDEPANLSESNLSHNDVLLNWDDVSGANSYEVRIKRSLAASWDTYTVTNSEYQASGLAEDGLYNWQVRTICGGAATSTWNGREFVNNSGLNNGSTTACSGRFTDSGGELHNYRNNESWTYTIAPTNATSVTLNFNTFNIEANYDYMYIYDGPTTASPLIGTYTGTTSPGSITSTGGSLTIRFTSDSWTVREGWTADWTCDAGIPILGNPILLDTTMAGRLDCGLSYHDFYDSGDLGGFYSNNENNEMTFCNPDPTQAVRISFRPNPTADQQLSISSQTGGNDYLYIYNGESSAANLIGAHTGASSAAPQPGTFISSGNCLTVKMETDASFVGNGWIARLYCASPPTDLGTLNVGGAAGTQVFADQGGTAANYGNNENYRVTYCPDASAPAGEVVWADFGSSIVGIERNWDYLYVYDGPDMDSRLIAVYTGDATNVNHLGIIKASIENASGCLTFQFFSDGATVASGWRADMYTGAARLSYGADNCSNATPITQLGATYAGSTTTAIGEPGNPDPNLNIGLASLPECSGANEITRLENTVWYRFSTPDTICNATNFNVRLDNISCQSEVPNGSGVQFVLYDAASCQSGAGWGTPLYCADKLVNGDVVDVAPYLTPNTSYYIMIDGFTGQNCNFDIDMVAVGATGNPCSLPLDLLEFRGIPMSDHVKLDWVTAFESEFEGFMLQRAMPDGLTFEDIAFIPARGANTALETAYDYPDYDYHVNKVNYYRLKEINFDGSIAYHPVVSVDMRRNDSENEVIVAPNPATNQISFSMHSEWAGPYELILYDMTGREIFSIRGEVTKGLWREFMDISALPAGIYAYQIRFPHQYVGGRFEKVK
jgi:N-acetyl-anhydromuramyl-L-alanine amidase AmpD